MHGAVRSQEQQWQDPETSNHFDPFVVEGGVSSSGMRGSVGDGGDGRGGSRSIPGYGCEPSPTDTAHARGIVAPQAEAAADGRFCAWRC